MFSICQQFIKFKFQSVQVLYHLPYIHLNLVTYLNYAWLWRKFSVFHHFSLKKTCVQKILFTLLDFVWCKSCVCVCVVRSSRGEEEKHQILFGKSRVTLREKNPRKIFVLVAVYGVFKLQNFQNISVNIGKHTQNTHTDTHTFMQKSNQGVNVCSFSIYIKLSNH